jgi:RNA polymerase sigma-70 factor (ECF subfamily)
LLEDHAWLADLFEAHVELVGRTLRAHGVASADIADACQEVFVIAHRRRADVIPGTSPRPWLYRIAANTASNHRRARARRREDMSGVVIESEVPPDQLGALERRADVDLALRLLESVVEEKREVFLLHDVEDVSMQEITAAIGIPLKTGYSRLRLAREQLAAAKKRHAARRER